MSGARLRELMDGARREPWVDRRRERAHGRARRGPEESGAAPERAARVQGFVIIFAAVWGLVLGAWWIWQRSRKAAGMARLRKRLAPAPAAEAAGKRSPALIRTDDPSAGRMALRLLRQLKLTERIKLLLEQTGLKWAPARLVHASLALLLAGFAATWYGTPAYRAAALPVGAILGALPFVYVLRLRSVRLHKFEEQFPESLEFLSRSMRAGHAFTVSLELIHSEFREPLAGEFRRAFEEQNLGLPLEVALANMAQRVPSMDVHFFVSAVVLQKRTGGNLAELLDKLASLIRERFKLRGRIRAISAHGKMTGVVLSMIPAAVGLIMCYVNPDYARFFSQEETGRQLIAGAVLLQLLGFGIIRKIVSIEV